LSSFATQASIANRFFQLAPIRRFDRWVNAMPHPPVVVEIAGPHVAVARWGGKSGRLEDVAVEVLPAGAVMPSTLETNIVQPEAVRSALRQIFNRVSVSGVHVALLVPDLVVRVFILPFDNLPRRASEALPLLRWRLKKSVPFDVEETAVSWMRQDAREGGLEIVTAVARQPILREYEALVETLGARAGVVLSSTLAALALLEERGSTLLVRICGKTLTTAIVRGRNLCLYRSTELRTDAASVEPQSILDEVFPAAAFYQDSWGETVERVRLSGFGGAENSFAEALAAELAISAGSMSEAVRTQSLDSAAKDLIPHGLDALFGWMMNSRP
jgi:type IV pilus assembly protein PilM